MTGRGLAPPRRQALSPAAYEDRRVGLLAVNLREALHSQRAQQEQRIPERIRPGHRRLPAARVGGMLPYHLDVSGPGQDAEHREVRARGDDVNHLAAADLDDFSPPSAEARRRSRPRKGEPQVGEGEHRAVAGSRRSVQSRLCHGQT